MYRIKKSLLDQEVETLKRFQEDDLRNITSGLGAVLALLLAGEFAVSEEGYNKIPDILKDHFEFIE